MSANRKPVAQPWIWDRGKPGASHGAMVRAGDRSVFVPGDYLRLVADNLHDIADEIDLGTLTTDRRRRPGIAPEGARQEGRSNAE